jgi:uncharacterized protein YebE (UPF0316 family)
MSFQTALIGALVIFFVRLLSMAVSTVRLLVMGRVNTFLLMTLAGIEALTFALSLGLVASNLGDLLNLGAYCVGFAVGTVVGMWIEERLAAGFSTINIVSMGKSLPIANAIRAAGFGATRSSGEGGTGTVGLVRVVTRRRNSSEIFKLVMKVDSAAFVTVEETRAVAQGFLQKISGK